MHFLNSLLLEINNLSLLKQVLKEALPNVSFLITSYFDIKYYVKGWERSFQFVSSIPQPTLILNIGFIIDYLFLSEGGHFCHNIDWQSCQDDW